MASDLRPSPSRIRETLFNWLQDTIVSANCLDLFSGSGILAWEALSRGAKSVQSIELESKIAKNLLSLKIKWPDFDFSLYQGDCLSWLRDGKSKQNYDIIFIDPPYAKNLVIPCLKLLLDSNLLHAKTLIYFEHNQLLILDDLPFSIIKQKKAGHVYYGLIQLGTNINRAQDA